MSRQAELKFGPTRFPVPDADEIHRVGGLRLGTTEAGIKKSNRKDLLVMTLPDTAKIAGVFTQNRFCAAPVIVAREHLNAGSRIRALVVNTGNANAGTGKDGLQHARQTCAELARLLDCRTMQVLPFSTGVIMEPLPVDRILKGLPNCIADLHEDNWLEGARAIMTTDTGPKVVSRRFEIAGAKVAITGIAKGAGMIHPNMATMLAFVATDARVSQPLLQDVVRTAGARSFNRISIDGDTSTNDAFMLIATGAAEMDEITAASSPELAALQDAVGEVALALAQAIVRDGEGATKFITISVEQGRDEPECEQIAFAIGNSPLVKTAFFASDPNLGRILAAIGGAGIANLDVGRVSLYLDDVLVAERGSRAASYDEAAGQRVMRQAEINVRVTLNRGAAAATIWTCDLSHDYVSINADYRS